MKSPRRQYEEFAIIPLAGRAIFTMTPSRPLVLPTKTRTSMSSTHLLVIAIVSISLWSLPIMTRAAVTTNAVYQATNIARDQAHLDLLHHDPRLDASAKLKADDMFAQQYFAHESPTGQRGWNWMSAAGYEYTEAGENLAMDFSDGSDVVAAWMTSATHRQNILNPKFTDVGVAAVAGVLHGKKTVIIVAHFGRQTSPVAIAATPQPHPATQIYITPSAPPPPVAPAPVPATKLVPSLMNPTGVPIRTLTFTYTEPIIQKPEVLGASTAIESFSTVVPQDDNLGWLILGTLCLSGSIAVLASVLWPSIYPQPLSPARV